MIFQKELWKNGFYPDNIIAQAGTNLNCLKMMLKYGVFLTSRNGALPDKSFLPAFRFLQSEKTVRLDLNSLV